VRNFVGLVVLAIAIGAIWQLLTHFKVEGLQSIRFVKRDVASTDVSGGTDIPIQRAADTIRVATFNLSVLGHTKINTPHVVDRLAQICRQFDIIAVQEICSSDEDIMPRLIDAINSAGRHYDYAIGPRLPQEQEDVNREQYAFIFDQASVELDRAQLYTIDDPDDLLIREPLVGWFRVRGPIAEQAFTFTLVNVHIDPDQPLEEIEQLAQVYRAVHGDGRGEDDVFILGDFSTDERDLESFASTAGIAGVLAGTPTDTRHTRQYDNIFFQRQATNEFVGRAGIYDFMRELNLRLEEALDVSAHVPVWADFTIYEGGRPGTVASRPRDER
jgi:deoxyribonuclease-1-like protein